MYTDTIIGSAVAALALIAGAWLAGIRTPNPVQRSSLQHLAAGVILGVVAAELIPEAMATGRSFEVGLGFALGLGLMLFAKWLAERVFGNENRAGLLVAAELDVTIDGLLIGVAFAIGSATGALLVLAFTLELGALGLAVGAGGEASQKRDPRRTLRTALWLALPVVPAALLGQAVLSQMATAFQAGLMGFASAVLVYLVVEELIREAHEVEERPLATALFFIGFLGIVLLQMEIKSRS